MLPTPADLARTHDATRRATQRTPMMKSEALPRAGGVARAFVKAESLQSAGSFKIRGADWRLCCLTAQERARGVVAYSSGNFAQGLAAAGRSLGVPVTIVMPQDAPAIKQAATHGYGAVVVPSDHGSRPRKEVAAALAPEIAAMRGQVLLHPFNNPLIEAGQAGAGQAGAGLEALEPLADLGVMPQAVVCPLGGGGLMGGVAPAFHHAVPCVRLWAVEPDGLNGMGLSLAAGAMCCVPGGGSKVCDAPQATAPGTAPLLAARAAGVTGVAVGDRAVARAMRFAIEPLKLVLEPSGAVALAAVPDRVVPVQGRSVVVYATGGDVALDRFIALVGNAVE